LRHGGEAAPNEKEMPPAGVHLSRRGRPMRPFRRLGHRERVHVGAKADGARSVAELQRADHARSPEAAMHLQRSFAEQLRYDIAGALFLEAELGMGMEVPAQRGQEGQVVQDFV
jgi:hypothetical protein